jgi:glycosyltransferase involved in cell wall biosynthesis
MPKRKVLYVCHNHPSVRPGGAEAYALELYESMRMSTEFEPVFLAKAGPPISNMRRPHEGTLLGRINGDPNQYFFYTDGASYDWFYGTSPDKDVYTKHFRAFLEAVHPDIVHFQHTLFFGYDILRETRNALPNATIIYTLHEYLPICHRQGQMVRTRANEPCRESSPQRCHECFPETPPQAFLMRKRFTQSHFAVVDLFLAPSRFLLDKYVAWGIPGDKIRFEEYGRIPANPFPEPDGRPIRNCFAFFGQLSLYKGINVLLEAMTVLRPPETPVGVAARQRRLSAVAQDRSAASDTREVEPHLRVHGANLELQPGQFQNEFRALLEATKHNVTYVGRYDHDALPALMAGIDWVVVPSIWWENSPLVIQEAFAHGRPVICSDIGGMAEKVTDGVNGLHFRAGDARSLAQTIRRATMTPGLWDALRRGIREVYRMDEHVASLCHIYQSLLDRRTSDEVSDARHRANG